MAAVAFLRGINLGNRRVTNDDLIAILTGAGWRDVSAYQASGNLVVGGADTLEAPPVSAALSAALGYDVTVFVRSADELRAIASDSPIAGRIGAAGGKPQIVFLGATPDVDPADVVPDDHEVYRVGAQLHWLPPAGLSESGAVQARMDRVFGPTTVRTLGTIERLVRRLA